MTPLEDSDFFLCEEDGQEFYQLNIQEGYKIEILENQEKLKKIKEFIKKHREIMLVNGIELENKDTPARDPNI